MPDDSPSARLGRFLFPALCVGCKTEGSLYLCQACREELEPTRSLLAGAELCTLGRYDATMTSCLSAVKQQGRKALGGELAALAAAKVHALWGSGTPRTVYSVRPSRAGQRFRGFSLPQMMERAVLEATGWHALPPELWGRFPGQTSTSRGLGLAQRLARGGPSLRQAPSEVAHRGPLLILDDVVTTGATLAAAVETARALGFEPISCFALALA